MKKSIILWTSVLILVAAAAVTQEPAQEKGPPTTDDELTRTFNVKEPPVVVPQASDPGEGPLLARAFEGAPALIPHTLEDMVPITRDENLCIDCHFIEEAEEGDPTPIPESHLRDMRRSPEKVGEAVAGARYNCVLCHVAPSSAAPLVGNRFRN